MVERKTIRRKENGNDHKGKRNQGRKFES